MARGMGCAYPSIVTPHGEILHSERYDRGSPTATCCSPTSAPRRRAAGPATSRAPGPSRGAYSTTQREIYEVVLGGAEAGDRRGDARQPLPKRSRARVLRRSRPAWSTSASCAAIPIELAADGVVALLFPHGIGHLLGLDVHDMEDLGDRAGYAPGRERAKEFGLRSLRLDRDLEPGMAVTIEPGFYVAPAILRDPTLTRVAGDRLDRKRLEAFADVRGIRIEDDILVTERGRDVLTEAIPKTIAAVEAAMAA